MFLSGIFNPLLAQVGSSCSNPINLGKIRDTSFVININYPDTVKWYYFTNDSLAIHLSLRSEVQSGYRAKLLGSELKTKSCSNLIRDGFFPYPGEFLTYNRLLKTNVSDTIVFGIFRTYDSSCGSCDSVAEQIKLNFRQEVGFPNCAPGNCSSIVTIDVLCNKLYFN
jgi:hypothetical protein